LKIGLKQDDVCKIQSTKKKERKERKNLHSLQYDKPGRIILRWIFREWEGVVETG
jgi:hypothetical protein